jgi:hypothetical protein
MQLRGLSVDKGPIFAEDILYIEVVGNTRLYLTVVNLLGLITIVNKE